MARAADRRRLTSNEEMNMALVNDIDEAAGRVALERWLSAKLPEAKGLKITELTIPHAAGLSMITLVFAVEWQEDGAARRLDLIARIAPTGPGIFERPELGKEFAVIDALGRHTDVVVPATRWFEPDLAVLGSEFLVQDRVMGQIPADDPPYVVTGWVVDLQPSRRAKLTEGALTQLARIHAVDWKSLGLGLLDRPELGEPGLEQQLALWRHRYEWAAGRPGRSQLIEYAFAWLDEHRPPDGELVLNWGDPRFGNILFDPASLDVAAVLDWDCACLGAPEMDLGWYLMFDRYYSDGIGVPRLDGLPDREGVISLYERLSGRTATNVEYHEVFAATRLSTLMVRAGDLMIAAGKLPADSPMPVSNPASAVLAGLLGQELPGGEVGNFVGQR